ncbi:hypothetical protein CC86DRAFT_467488 [Ophiobolus disseminans]|uniref:Uncharacterized protein n=1 Tax=Ophiobolus disseminans TaxID=1469910 RepID=A0A6A6ZXV5_9PLEO|nr:hypothetical protein CC86DRAFT_467488 [Ophiobolus disseminans]
MRLTFPPRPPPRPKKRSRATADIDGEHSCTQKKKRRLRLFLITSRLSPQFSHPATNIVDRGSSKIAVWAKQKSLGRNLLRKAAILNRIRRRAIYAKEVVAGHGRSLVEQEREQEELKLAKLEFNHGSVDTYTRPVTCQTPSVPPAVAVRSGGRFVVSGSPTGSPTSSRSPSPTPPSPPPKRGREEETPSYCSPNDAYADILPRAQLPRREYIPLPPSPLGLSNYDAFDADEDMPDPYSHLDDDDDDDGHCTNLFDDDEDDADIVPFSPSAVTSASSSTIQTQASQVLKTPPQKIYSDFSTLDHGEPVFGDYDQVDDGAETVWPSTTMQEATSAPTHSTSPDFSTLFTTAPPKRSDSFATSPNFRPTRPTASRSPNFPPVSHTVPPNFVPTSHPSPNYTSIAHTSAPSMALSPNFSPSTAPTASIPHTFLSPHHHNAFAQRRMSVPTKQRSEDERTRRNSDIDQERKRQRDLMFARFRS